MKRMLLLVLIFSSRTAVAEWSAPANPDPKVILNEAQADARAGRYEDALAKQIWFHEHALEYREALFGVRLSFALASWHSLADAYPPALDSLKKTRDDAAQKALKSTNKAALDAFFDMSSINRELDEDQKTVEVFEQLDKAKPQIAATVYVLAQPALIKAKKYELCGKYLTPGRTTDRMIYTYQLTLKFANDETAQLPNSRVLEQAENAYTRNAATLIALLVLNKREADAATIAERVRKESPTPDREKAVAAALKGELPTSSRD